MFYCYLLNSGKSTYIGATIDVDRRLDQHNGKKSGGAKRTHGHQWKRVMYVSGIPDWQTALQFEWAWKHAGRKNPGWRGKVNGLLELIKKEKPTRNSNNFSEWSDKFSVHPSPEYIGDVGKIEGWNALEFVSGPAITDKYFRIPSFRYIPTMTSVSPSDIAKLATACELMASEIASLKDRLNAALATAPAAGAGVVVAAVKEKKARKPREVKVKEKLVCPEKAAGVIRFYSSGGDSEHKFLSNLFRAEFLFNGKKYPSVENYFHSEKYAETDPEYADKIRTQKNPVLTRGMGKSKAHKMRDDWDTVRMDKMRIAIAAKFGQNAELSKLLAATGTATLEEENPADDFWGIGALGTGQNWIGKLLMAQRDGK